MIEATRHFETRLTPADCAARLGSKFNWLFLPGSADSSGFRVAKGRRALVRAHGTFQLQPGGTTLVDYRTEINRPLIVVTTSITVPGLAIVAAALASVHVSVLLLWPFIPALVLVVLSGFYLSARQAAWLDQFVRRELDTPP